ncbi:MAG: hypothetical protein AAGB32_02120 [Pseudomonadota bacterium]
MVYIFALVGFVMGFAVGLGTINVLLRNRSIEDVKKDKQAKWKYGLLVWAFGFIGGYIGIFIHNNYF